jgi:hypothetical protein
VPSNVIDGVRIGVNCPEASPGQTNGAAVRRAGEIWGRPGRDLVIRAIREGVDPTKIIGSVEALAKAGRTIEDLSRAVLLEAA